MTSPLNQDKMKKVICWLSERCQQQPEKARGQLLQEAEIRFDLSPKECLFLDRNFSKQEPKS